MTRIIFFLLILSFYISVVFWVYLYFFGLLFVWRKKSEKSEKHELIRLALVAGCGYSVVVAVVVVAGTVFPWMLCDSIENCIKTAVGSPKFSVRAYAFSELCKIRKFYGLCFDGDQFNLYSKQKWKVFNFSVPFNLIVRFICSLISIANDIYRYNEKQTKIYWLWRIG